MKLGIITYQERHLKTEQILLNLHYIYDVVVYALPFISRKPREVLFQHRPDQLCGAHPKDICDFLHIAYVPVNKDVEIPNECELYLITGAGILTNECLQGKKVLNVHPGVIPAARGLDAFKWSIYNLIPVGNTLHYIDEKVDAGEVVSIMPTPVFESDSLMSFARRHYENEIKLLSNFKEGIEHPVNPFYNIPERDSMRRMKREIEEELEDKFLQYKTKYCKNINISEKIGGGVTPNSYNVLGGAAA